MEFTFLLDNPSPFQLPLSPFPYFPPMKGTYACQSLSYSPSGPNPSSVFCSVKMPGLGFPSHISALSAGFLLVSVTGDMGEGGKLGGSRRETGLAPSCLTVSMNLAPTLLLPSGSCDSFLRWRWQNQLHWVIPPTPKTPAPAHSVPASEVCLHLLLISKLL